ncbi:EamA family transporter [Fictibacillus aquaticus]|uniref:EamA domain-containing protein n=1 Tax=Fictibacillus aquaticus TaxID=2021314 RepID=A0A235F8W0_9BACL|nr:EamA family transporter [Fictibacillus aquaticus]OYD57746.1 hypothetical protein CGZ90_13890 [Fictibacillus aquaticus]
MSFLNMCLILLNTLILVSGQFLWKMGLESRQPDFSSLMGIIRLLLSPWIFTGIVAYGLATVLWLLILSRVQLSVAYPLQSTAYIIAVIGSYYLFNEPLTIYKVGGCMLIMAGVSIITISQ